VRHLAGQQVIEGAAEAVEVGADVGLVQVAGLLGRQVVGRAHDRVFPGHDGADAALGLGARVVQRARPKSLIFTMPGRARPSAPGRCTRMFAGLMSRWTTAHLEAYCSPSSHLADEVARLPTGSGPRSRTSSSRLGPSTYSRTR